MKTFVQQQLRPNRYWVIGLIMVLGFGLWLGSNRETMGQAAKEEATLRHVVLFRFKEGTKETDIEKVVNAFQQLPSKISAVASFEYGTNNSPEGLADGHSHCFLLSFKNEKDRQVYLEHPEHKAFVDVLLPHLDKATVVDYFAKK